MRGFLPLLLGALFACERPMHVGDPDLYGVQLAVHDDAAAYTRAADFRPRVKRLLERAAAFYGHAPEEFVGLCIEFQGTPVVCGGQSGDQGCNDPATNTISIATLLPDCFLDVESSVLPHELLHYFIV